jgi:hypothetical protein
MILVACRLAGQGACQNDEVHQIHNAFYCLVAGLSC